MNLEAHLQKYISFYLVLTMVCWGVSWPTSKILTNYTDVYTLMFLKFFLSALTIIPLLYLFLKPERFFHIGILKPLFYATLFLTFYNILFFYGLKVGYAGLGGVIVTGSNPIFTFLIVAILEKIKIPKNQKLALILGVIGTVITADVFSIELSNILDGGNLIFLLSSLAWSFLTIISAKPKQLINPIVFTVYLYFSSSLVTLIFFGSVSSVLETLNFDFIFWLNIIFTTVITSGIATTFYFYASSHMGASHASSYIFLVPLVAVVSSNIFLDEIPHLTTIIGGAILIYSVYLINKK